MVLLTLLLVAELDFTTVNCTALHCTTLDSWLPRAQYRVGEEGRGPSLQCGLTVSTALSTGGHISEGITTVCDNKFVHWVFMNVITTKSEVSRLLYINQDWHKPASRARVSQ